MLINNIGKKEEAKYTLGAMCKQKETITFASYDPTLDMYIIGYLNGILELYKLIVSKGDDNNTKQEFVKQYEFSLFTSAIIYLMVIKKGLILGVSKDNYVKLFSIESKKIIGGGTFVKKLENREPTCALYYSKQNEIYIGTSQRLCLHYQYMDDNTFQFKSYINIDNEDNAINSLSALNTTLIATAGSRAYIYNIEQKPLVPVSNLVGYYHQHF